MVLVSEIRYLSPEKGHLPTAILCHHYNMTIKGSMCIQVGNLPTWLTLHQILQLFQKWNAQHTRFNNFWLPYLSGYTEVNPGSRFNVLNPIDGPLSNYTYFRADIPLTNTVLLDMQHLALNFISTFDIMKLLRLRHHEIIFQSTKFTSKVIVRPIAVWQPFCIYWICVSEK